jgi:hypothetical protein
MTRRYDDDDQDYYEEQEREYAEQQEKQRKYQEQCDEDECRHCSCCCRHMDAYEQACHDVGEAIGEAIVEIFKRQFTRKKEK